MRVVETTQIVCVQCVRVIKNLFDFTLIGIGVLANGFSSPLPPPPSLFQIVFTHFDIADNKLCMYSNFL